MNQKSIKPGLLLSLLVPLKMIAVPEQASVNFDDDYVSISPKDSSEITRSRKRKKFCSVIARNGCFGNLRAGNLNVSGSLTVGGVNFNSLSTIINILNSGSPLVRSVVPFSSGLITVGAAPFLTIPLTGLDMAFGSSSLVPVAGPTVIPTKTGFAFSVPEDGTLYNLTVSVDSVYAIALAVATPITFTFTVLRSPCVDGVISPYASTGLTATATTTTPAGTVFPLVAVVEGVTGCGSNAAGIPVLAGDRITIEVTPSIPVTPLILTLVAFSAGLDYAPTL